MAAVWLVEELQARTSDVEVPRMWRCPVGPPPLPVEGREPGGCKMTDDGHGVVPTHGGEPGVSRWFTPLACGPGYPEMSRSIRVVKDGE